MNEWTAVSQLLFVWDFLYPLRNPRKYLSTSRHSNQRIIHYTCLENVCHYIAHLSFWTKRYIHTLVAHGINWLLYIFGVPRKLLLGKPPSCLVTLRHLMGMEHKRTLWFWIALGMFSCEDSIAFQSAKNQYIPKIFQTGLHSMKLQNNWIIQHLWKHFSHSSLLDRNFMIVFAFFSDFVPVNSQHAGTELSRYN